MNQPSARRRVRPQFVYLGAALACVAAAALLLWPSETPRPEAPARPTKAATLPIATPALRAAIQPPLAVASASAPDQTSPPPDHDDLAAHVPAGQAPSMAQVIQRLHAAGVHTGLGAFQPPGTRPPLVGLAVPEDFALPDGYVRHHQATDDGQRIEAILMFAPDRQFVDAQGRVITVPPDRVVPPEWAPPGLPLRRIVVPPPLDSSRPTP